MTSIDILVMRTSELPDGAPALIRAAVRKAFAHVAQEIGSIHPQAYAQATIDALRNNKYSTFGDLYEVPDNRVIPENRFILHAGFSDPTCISQKVYLLGFNENSNMYKHLLGNLQEVAEDPLAAIKRLLPAHLR